MTNSQNKDGGGGLPTAAYSFVVEEAQLSSDENHKVVKFSDPRDSNSIEGIRHEDNTVKNVNELVRRSDVKRLIQDKIEKYDRPTTDPYVQHSIVDKLEELLEELEK